MNQNPPPDLRLRQLKDGNPGIRQPSVNWQAPDQETPEELCLFWEDGRKRLFYYHSLDDIDLMPGDEQNILTLEFVKKTVTLKGINLHELFFRFWQHRPSVIYIVSPRYAVLGRFDDYMVTEAIIEKQ